MLRWVKIKIQDKNPNILKFDIFKIQVKSLEQKGVLRVENENH